MSDKPFQTSLTKATGYALDAEAGRDIAAVACSAARTAEKAAVDAPELAPRLHPLGTLAAEKAKVAAQDSFQSAGRAMAIAKMASLHDGAEPVEAAAKQAIAAAEQAESLAKGAAAAAFKIGQAALVATGDATSPLVPVPAPKKPDRPLVAAKVWK